MDAREVTEILSAGLQGASIDVRDDTHKHEGHNADVGHFGSHFLVKIIWDGFEGMPRLKRHRVVQGLLAKAWGENRIHSLSLRLMSKAEAPA